MGKQWGSCQSLDCWPRWQAGHLERYEEVSSSYAAASAEWAVRETEPKMLEIALK